MKPGETPCGKEYELVQVEAVVPTERAETVAESMIKELSELTHAYGSHLVGAAIPRVLVRNYIKIEDRRMRSSDKSSIIVTSGVPSSEVMQAIDTFRVKLAAAGGQNLVSDSVLDPIACNCCMLESQPNGLRTGGQIAHSEPPYVR